MYNYHKEVPIKENNSVRVQTSSSALTDSQADHDFPFVFVGYGIAG